MSGAWPVAIAQGWHPLAALDVLGSKPIARRVMGGGHPLTLDLQDCLRNAQATLRARETPSGSA